MTKAIRTCENSGESCRDTILKKAYPRLLEPTKDAPTTPSGDTTDQGKVMLRKAVEEERKRIVSTAAPDARCFCLAKFDEPLFTPVPTRSRRDFCRLELTPIQAAA